jgi:predicted nucleic acid-binding Zn ribbon protein
MTYLYETIPLRAGDQPRHYEIQQSMNDAPLTRHPQTGEAIRRVILGGWGLVTSKSASGSPSQGGCGCGPGGC